mmetsp:Transcript_45281/g.111071  ORF Transcript_45281/g.111071 Transcript_45281/m.111071 type:complete len:213 (+) Transcript_45281:1251-1889(+)
MQTGKLFVHIVIGVARRRAPIVGKGEVVHTQNLTRRPNALINTTLRNRWGGGQPLCAIEQFVRTHGQLGRCGVCCTALTRPGEGRHLGICEHGGFQALEGFVGQVHGNVLQHRLIHEEVVVAGCALEMGACLAQVSTVSDSGVPEGTFDIGQSANECGALQRNGWQAGNVIEVVRSKGVAPLHIAGERLIVQPRRNVVQRFQVGQAAIHGLR